MFVNIILLAINKHFIFFYGLGLITFGTNSNQMKQILLSELKSVFQDHNRTAIIKSSNCLIIKEFNQYPCLKIIYDPKAKELTVMTDPLRLLIIIKDTEALSIFNKIKKFNFLADTLRFISYDTKTTNGIE